MIARFVGTSGRVPYNPFYVQNGHRYYIYVKPARRYFDPPRGKQYVTVIDPGHGDHCTIPYDTLELVNRNWKVMSF